MFVAIADLRDSNEYEFESVKFARDHSDAKYKHVVERI